MMRWQFREHIYRDLVAKFDRGEDIPEPIEDVFAERYWSIPMQHDPFTGKANYDDFDAERQSVLNEARSRGVNVEFFITDRTRQRANPDVASKLNAYDRAMEVTKPFWTIGEDLAEKHGFLDKYMQFEALDDDAKAAIMSQHPNVRRMVIGIRWAKAEMRRNNPEMDRALREWFDFDVNRPPSSRQ